jgi:glycosyltransferase involved in cell wall biosynthesis
VSQVSVLTPSFPRYPGDYHGVFIKHLCDQLARHVNLEVIAPRTRTLRPIHSDYPIKRFPYMPSSRMEYIAEATMKNASKTVLTLLPAYLASAYINTIASESRLIHTHLAIPLGLIAAHNPKKTPQLITCHGSDVTYPVEKPIYHPIVRLVLRKADRIAAVSKYVHNLTVRLGADSRKTETIYLGVDVDRFKPEKKSHKITIGTLGRLVPEKNIHEILYAAKLIQPKVDFKIRLGGDGPEQPRLMKLAQKLDLEAEFTGRVSDPVGFHQSLDVFILASGREGLSMSLQEAMSCGAVPVAVNGSGCNELISDEINGYIFEAGDRKMLAAKILEAINNQKIGCKARDIIVKHFNSETATMKYLKLYSELGISFKL